MKNYNGASTAVSLARPRGKGEGFMQRTIQKVLEKNLHLTQCSLDDLSKGKAASAPSARRSCTGTQSTWPQYGTPVRTCSPHFCPANPEHDAGPPRCVPEWLCAGTALPRAASLIPWAWPRCTAVRATCPCSRLNRACCLPPPP